MELDKQFSIEQFEATVSQSTEPPPPTLLRIFSAFGFNVRGFDLNPHAPKLSDGLCHTADIALPLRFSGPEMGKLKWVS